MSSTNFTWSNLEYFVPNITDPKLQNILQVFLRRPLLDVTIENIVNVPDLPVSPSLSLRNLYTLLNSPSLFGSSFSLHLYISCDWWSAHLKFDFHLLASGFSPDIYDKYFIKNCSSEAYLEPSRTSIMELFCKNTQRLKVVHDRCSTGFRIHLCSSFMQNGNDKDNK